MCHSSYLKEWMTEFDISLPYGLLPRIRHRVCWQAMRLP